jgi:hypothetical protein
MKLVATDSVLIGKFAVLNAFKTKYKRVLTAAAETIIITTSLLFR